MGDGLALAVEFPFVDDQALESDGAAGRKLEFVTQEMFREANTMASKIGEPSLLQSVFELKNEVDRIREQVFNVE